MCLSHFKFYLAEGFLFFQDCVLTEEFLLFSFPTEKSHLNQRLLNVKNWRAFFKLASLAKIKLSSCARSKIYLFLVYDWEILSRFVNVIRRENVVRSLLCRYCCVSEDHANSEKERFMLNKLKIPAEWIHEAKVWWFVLGKEPFCFLWRKSVLNIQSYKVMFYTLEVTLFFVVVVVFFVCLFSVGLASALWRKNSWGSFPPSQGSPLESGA